MKQTQHTGNSNNIGQSELRYFFPFTNATTNPLIFMTDASVRDENKGFLTFQRSLPELVYASSVYPRKTSCQDARCFHTGASDGALSYSRVRAVGLNHRDALNRTHDFI